MFWSLFPINLVGFLQPENIYTRQKLFLRTKFFHRVKSGQPGGIRQSFVTHSNEALSYRCIANNARTQAIESLYPAKSEIRLRRPTKLVRFALSFKTILKLPWRRTLHRSSSKQRRSVLRRKQLDRYPKLLRIVPRIQCRILRCPRINGFLLSTYSL